VWHAFVQSKATLTKLLEKFYSYFYETNIESQVGEFRVFSIFSVYFNFVGFAYQGKKDIIVFRFIIEYSSSLRDFYRPLGNK
jgi:hypothetical protein